MTDLQMFLLENDVTNLTKEVIISERLKNYPFTIKCVSGKQFDEYQTQCITNASNPKKRKVDMNKFNELIVINHCVNPNFKDADWLSKSNTPTEPRKLLYKCLTAGEIGKLTTEILELSGFDDYSADEQQEEIKNF